MQSEAAHGRSRDVRRRDWIYGGHVFLAASMCLWRLLSATPGISSIAGGGVESSFAGRALALVTLLASVVLLFVIGAGSAARWRDPRTGLLAVLLALALARREGVDAFDWAYLGALLVLAALWFGRDRARERSAEARGARERTAPA